MKKFLLLVIIVLTLFSITSPAQWIQQASGTSNWLEEIFFPAPDTGYVAGWNGTLLKTTDGGNTWIALAPGTTLRLNDLFFLDTQTGFIVGDSGFFGKTLDGGNTWSIQHLTHINDIELSSVFFTDANTGFAGGRETLLPGIIFKTVNGGLNWTVSNIPFWIGDINFKRIYFPVPDTGYALTRGLCMKTTDNGNNWFITDTSLVASGGMFSILEDCHFSSANTGIIVGWYNPFNGYTTDGYHWTDNFVGNNQWFAVEFPTPLTGYLAGWGELYKTSDGGLTWYDISSPLVQNGSIFSMAFTDENTGYACGANGSIIKTTTGGVTGVGDFDVSEKAKLFPNPSEGVFKLEFQGEELKRHHARIQIHNLFSGFVFEKNILLTDENEFDVSFLSAGVYSLQIVLGEKILHQKVILQ